MIKTCVKTEYAVELGVAKEITRTIKELFLNFFTHLFLFVIFSLNGTVIANCCFAVIDDCLYFERFGNNFPLGLQSKVQ